MQEKGSISIHTENIFPIIKKFKQCGGRNSKIEKISLDGRIQWRVG